MKRIGWKVLVGFLIGCAAGGIAVIVLGHVRDRVEDSIFRAEAAGLWGAYGAWQDAGRPTGTNMWALEQRFQHYGWERAESTIVVGKQAYRTMFADPDLLYRPGRLLVTTNGAVLWENTKVILEPEQAHQ